MPKYLVIRFSSIGDIVLTSPVIRCLKKQKPDAEIHFVTKASFKVLLENNPYIEKVITFQKEIDEIADALKKENYDFVIDLHRNLRSTRLKQKLKKPSATFPKLNYKKFLLTTFKINKLPDIHVVDRYFKAVEDLGIVNDQLGLNYFIPAQDEVHISDFGIPEKFIAFSIGAQFNTKKLPNKKISELIQKINLPVVLLGGETDFDNASEISKTNSSIINLCGRINLNQAASIVKQATKVVTHDTGLMHIASSFNKPIISIWGNTVPAFGMYPYFPQNKNGFSIHEVKNLKCRPCSKIGYQKCPKKHFDCMMKHDLELIANNVNE